MDVAGLLGNGLGWPPRRSVIGSSENLVRPITVRDPRSSDAAVGSVENGDEIVLVLASRQLLDSWHAFDDGRSVQEFQRLAEPGIG